MPAPSTPVIQEPNFGRSFSTNIDLHVLRGTASFDTEQILVNGSPVGVIYTPGDLEWEVEVKCSSGTNIYVIEAQNSFGLSGKEIIAITLVDSEKLNLVLSPPTGLNLIRQRDKLFIEWNTNPETQVEGYNVYVSNVPGGGIQGYKKINRDLIAVPDRVEKVVVDRVQQLSADIDKIITTVTENTEDRTIFRFEVKELSNGAPLVEGQNVYIVIAAVGFDTILQEIVESSYSSEIFGSTFTVGPIVRDLLPKSEREIRQSILTKILRAQPDLNVSPGSYTSDVILQPIPFEIRRIYTVLEFISLSQSLLTLVEFDDSDRDRISDSFEVNSKKRDLRDALLLNEVLTQQIIDEQFDKIAANAGIQRKQAKRSTGFVTFYLSSLPSQNVSVPVGTLVSTRSDEESSAVQFQTTAEALINISQPAVYFNSRNRRYEVTVPVIAIQAGAQGNVPAGAITVSAAAGLRVVNRLATRFGINIESNADLADRAILSLAGVDSGTKNGYLRNVLAVPSVQRALIVDASNKNMFRDYDYLRERHAGGMVDIYVVGGVQEQVEETIAYHYPTVYRERVRIVDVNALRFEIENALVGPDSPIFQIVPPNDPTNTLKLSVYNQTRDLTYDIDGYVVDQGRYIDLDEGIALNSSIGLASTDIVLITYRYKPELRKKFTRQAVDEIVSVTGNISGDLGKNYDLIREDDPMTLGRSKLANDAIVLKPLNESSENIVLSGLSFTPLSIVGIIIGSVSVENISGSTVYTDGIDYLVSYGTTEVVTQIQRLPGGEITSGQEVVVKFRTIKPVLPLDQVETINSESHKLSGTVKIQLQKLGVLDGTIEVKSKTGVLYVENIDYDIFIGDGFTQTSISRSGPSSSILEGEEVDISYQSGENIVVRYLVNDLISQVDEDIQKTNHATGNFLVKPSFEVLVDIVMNISVRRELNIDIVDIKSEIATKLSNLFNAKGLGEGVGQSDIIGIVEGVRGVDRVTIPLEKMVRKDGTLIIREKIHGMFTPYASGFAQAWISDSPVLSQNTQENGGHRRQILDGPGFEYAPVHIVEDKYYQLETQLSPIDVAGGKQRGYILSDGRIILSTRDGKIPAEHEYSVTYIVFGSTGASDIDVTGLEFIRLGSLEINVIN